MVMPRKKHAVAAARKTLRRTPPSTTCAKHKNAKPYPVKATLYLRPPALLLDLRATSLGFLIVGIGGSACGLEAMEALRVPGR
jgi:hypothetical protein